MADAPATSDPPAQTPRTAPPVVRRLGLALLVLLLISLATTALGALRSVGGLAPDFEYFYRGGEALLRQGALDDGIDVHSNGSIAERDSLKWYLPFVPRLLTPLALLPPGAAGVVWLLCNVAAVAATLRLVGRHLVGLPPQDWPVTQLLPFLLCGLFWYWEFRLNQIDALTLLLLVGSFVCLQRRRPVISGFWLGLAILLKLTPMLILLWLILKRQKAAAITALLTAVIAGPAADAVIFGPRPAANIYAGWLQRALQDNSHRGLIFSQTEMDLRNQGLGAVASRWLHETNYAVRFDNDPRLTRRDPEAFLNVANLSRGQIAALVTTAHIVSLGLLVILLRRPLRNLSLWELRLEWALVLAAMLWFMPVVRAYHLIWLYPAVAVLGGTLCYAGFGRPWSIFTLACLCYVLLVQFSLSWPILHAAGGLLAAVVIVAGPIIVMLVRLQRSPSTLPEDAFAHLLPRGASQPRPDIPRDGATPAERAPA